MIKKSMGKVLGVTAIVTLPLAACGDNLFGPEPEDVVFAESLGIDLTLMMETASGLFFRDDVVGDGPVAATGDIATVTLTGWLVDGTEFDSGLFTFQIGAAGTLVGFSEGVTGMQAGGQRTFVVPASLGYGSSASKNGIIPKNAVLVFQVTLDVLISP